MVGPNDLSPVSAMLICLPGIGIGTEALMLALFLGRCLSNDRPVFEGSMAQCHSVSMQAIAGLEHEATPWLILQILHPSSNCWQVGFSRIFSASELPA
ncbi:hypothetical protein FJW07_30415 [Mesorhizobium sp. B3-1-9]|nr:hypothetical protein FJW07_30415 [Mesorhizobium sp. B3-1-9]